MEGFIKALIEYQLVESEYLFLHASALKKNGAGLVFVGKPGTGKSTIVKGVPPSQVLGDDIVIIRKINQKFFIHSSPFDFRLFPDIRQNRTPLIHTFFISQAKKTFTKLLSPYESLALLLRNNFLASIDIIPNNSYQTNLHVKIDIEDLQRHKKIINDYFQLIFALLTKVPMSKLFFTKDLRFLSKI